MAFINAHILYQPYEFQKLSTEEKKSFLNQIPKMNSNFPKSSGGEHSEEEQILRDLIFNLSTNAENNELDNLIIDKIPQISRECRPVQDQILLVLDTITNPNIIAKLLSKIDELHPDFLQDLRQLNSHRKEYNLYNPAIKPLTHLDDYPEIKNQIERLTQHRIAALDLKRSHHDTPPKISPDDTPLKISPDEREKKTARRENTQQNTTLGSMIR